MIIIIIVTLGVIALGFILYKILKEESTVFKEEKKIENEKKEKEKAENKVINIWEKIAESGFDNYLNEIQNDSEELFKTKVEIQTKLRSYVKAGDTNNIRMCNEYLKKIDEVKKKGN